MSNRFFRRSRAVLTGLALCGAATAAVAASGAASAAPLPSTGATATGAYYAFSAASSGLYLDVQGGSTAKNALVIQWTPTDTGSEIWHVGSNGRIRNLNSGMCLTTDGTEGDQLYQRPCRRSLAAYQVWAVVPLANGLASIVNPAFNLLVDVYNNNTTLGGPIDAWPNNGGQPNQQFTATAIIVEGPKG